MMSDEQWVRFSDKLRIPKGARFDFATGQWFIPTPTEPRPLFARLLAGEDLPLIVLSQEAYVLIGLGTGVLEEGKNAMVGEMERLTHDEFSLLNSRSEPKNQVEQESDPDILYTGPGLPMSFSVNPIRGKPLKSEQRGLILSSGIREAPGTVEIRLGFDPDELRSSLLLWDRLDWPEHSVINSVPDADAQLLLDEGVMQRTRFRAGGVMFRKSELANLHEKAFLLAEEEEPGRWAVASGSRSKEVDYDGRGILIGLHDAIIIPDRQVSLDEVLKFKEDRSAELQALRHHLHSLYETVRNSADQPAAWADATDKLNISVRDQIRVASERGWGKRVLRTLSASISVDMGGAAIVAGGAILSGAPVVPSLSTAASFVSWKMVSNIKASDKVPDPLRYVFSMHKHL